MMKMQEVKQKSLLRCHAQQDKVSLVILEKVFFRPVVLGQYHVGNQFLWEIYDKNGIESDMSIV